MKILQGRGRKSSNNKASGRTFVDLFLVLIIECRSRVLIRRQGHPPGLIMARSATHKPCFDVAHSFGYSVIYSI